MVNEDFINVKTLVANFLVGNANSVGLVADVGSVQGGQVLTSSFNVIDTSGTAGNAVTLPSSFNKGTVIFIKNGAAANSIDVFPALGDDLGAGANTAVALAAGKGIAYIGTTADTTWEPLFTGA